MNLNSKLPISQNLQIQNSTQKTSKIATLRPPLGTLVFRLQLHDDFSIKFDSIFRNYPALYDIHQRIVNCGRGTILFRNKKTNDTLEIPTYCDNRICNNPECKTHRLYKYMRQHNRQIKILNDNMKAPKAWVFSTPILEYPIKRNYLEEQMHKLLYLLNRDKHLHYGSVSHCSIHMEIKPHPPNYRDTSGKLHKNETWYLHFHVASGGIKNLKLIRQIWKSQIKYEKAINKRDLAYYVSKYSSKVPYFPSALAMCEYLQGVYKLQMHRYLLLESANNNTSVNLPKITPSEDWELVLMIFPAPVPISDSEVVKFYSGYMKGMIPPPEYEKEGLEQK